MDASLKRGPPRRPGLLVRVETQCLGARWLGEVRALCVATGLAALLSAAAAQALGPTLEFYEGPVNSSQRVVGLGGAFAAVAEGAEAHLVNPAAFALRPLFAKKRWFDWDVGMSVFSGLGASVNLDQNRLGARADSARLSQIGFNLKFGRLGVGFHMRSQDYALRVTPRERLPATFDLQQSFGGFGLAYALGDGEWVLGTVMGLGTGQLSHSSGSAELRLGSPLGFHNFGFVHAPRGERWRIGGSLQLPVVLRPEDLQGDPVTPPETLGNRATPGAILLPWQAAMGLAWMWGRRPLNQLPGYLEPAGSPSAVARDYVLATADLVLTGPGNGAVGVQPYLAGLSAPIGRIGTPSVRAGVESEVLANRLVLRGGSYFEPSRYQGSLGRVHATGGADVRLTWGWDWRITWCFDIAQGYVNSAFGLGLWH